MLILSLILCCLHNPTLDYAETYSIFAKFIWKHVARIVAQRKNYRGFYDGFSKEAIKKHTFYKTIPSARYDYTFEKVFL